MMRRRKQKIRENEVYMTRKKTTEEFKKKILNLLDPQRLLHPA